ncbi:endonuclease [Legionella pneumophila]|nr:endonuclease [Legionella pneumophila]MCZ4786700.1 endonuclease [Legionella pneumophila]
MNQALSNYHFAQLTQQSNYYGCPISIDKSSRQVELSNEVKGVIARAHMFMSQRYKIPLSPAQKNLFLYGTSNFLLQTGSLNGHIRLH